MEWMDAPVSDWLHAVHALGAPKRSISPTASVVPVGGGLGGAVDAESAGLDGVNQEDAARLTAAWLRLPPRRGAE